MMRRLIAWLGQRLFSGTSDDQADLQQSGVRVRPPSERPAAARPAPPPKPEVTYETELGGRIEDGGPGKNVLVRNKYLREDSGTHERLKIIDESLLVEDEDSGIDPYNTGRFDRAKSWNRGYRK